MLSETDPAEWRRSFLIIWGPWILILAVIGGVVTMVMAQTLRGIFRRRGDLLALRTMYATIVYTGVVFATLIAVAAMSGPRSPFDHGLLFLAVFLLLNANICCAVGAGCFTIWRLLRTPAPRPESAAR